ncbi:MAG: PilZ domain-containing protein [Bryobacterales bacterium]|nr:PilZ domain-containing protein [Bryobacterales bacterium]
MQDRRFQPRMLCADLVNIQWTDEAGRSHRTIANLEDISLSGACLQLDHAIPLNTKLRISYPKGQMEGVVRYCVYREIGYFIGLQFQEGSGWSRKSFKPQHLFDPRRLTAKTPKVRPDPPIELGLPN